LYGSIHLFGGEIFLHEDIFEVLDYSARLFKKVYLHSNGRIFCYKNMARKLTPFNVGAVKVPFFSLHEDRFDAFTRTEGSYQQTVQGIRNLCEQGIPVCIYIPKREYKGDVRFLKRLGVASISTYEFSENKILSGAVFCSGKSLKTNFLQWMKN